jgi:hypothetical protein
MIGEGSSEEDGRGAAQTAGPIEFQLEVLSNASFADEDCTHHGVDGPSRRFSKSAALEVY